MVELFAQGKRLEALPLLESLVKANPKDDEMLVDLAASLVDHAATLTDDQAAGKERLRARDLLDKAWDLGNTSPLALNLSQLLRQLPPSGAIQFSSDPRVEQAMRAGEAAFASHDFDSALVHYAKALEIEPGNYAAALFTGNTYDRENNFAKGAEWYKRAIQINPDIESAYRYYADMLAREGDMRKARTLLIHAVVAEPYNRIVWRELHAWATLNQTRINEILIGLPDDREGGPGSESEPPVSQLSAVSKAYREVRANWQQGGEYQKRFPEAKEYRHSLAEETEALTAAVNVLQKIQQVANIAALVHEDTSLSLLLKLHEAGLIESYVLFSLGDAGIARDYAAYREKNRDKLQRYVDTFVVPAAPSAR